jgi:hypothetical protein
VHTDVIEVGTEVESWLRGILGAHQLSAP